MLCITPIMAIMGTMATTGTTVIMDTMAIMDVRLSGVKLSWKKNIIIFSTPFYCILICIGLSNLFQFPLSKSTCEVVMAFTIMEDSTMVATTTVIIIVDITIVDIIIVVNIIVGITIVVIIKVVIIMAATIIAVVIITMFQMITTISAAVMVEEKLNTTATIMATIMATMDTMVTTATMATTGIMALTTTTTIMRLKRPFRRQVQVRSCTVTLIPFLNYFYYVLSVGLPFTLSFGFANSSLSLHDSLKDPNLTLSSMHLPCLFHVPHDL